MPIFKSTYNILKKPDEDEVYNPNWFDTPFLQTPTYKKWDYKREMKIEDVDIWEVLAENGGGFGVYAAWSPYAEFYLITTGSDDRNQWTGFLDNATYNYCDKFYETYYGPLAQKMVEKRALELGIILKKSFIWIDEEDTWLFTKPEKSNLIL